MTTKNGSAVTNCKQAQVHPDLLAALAEIPQEAQAMIADEMFKISHWEEIRLFLLMGHQVRWQNISFMVADFLVKQYHDKDEDDPICDEDLHNLLFLSNTIREIMSVKDGIETPTIKYVEEREEFDR